MFAVNIPGNTKYILHVIREFRMRQLEEPERRAAKWILYDDRVQKLCDSFNRQTNVVNFWKKVANVC